MSRKPLTIQEQEIAFRKVHGNKYTYDWTTYVDNSTKMRINCEEHSWFKQKPNDHKGGRGCPKCGYMKSAESNTLSFEEVVSVCNRVHNFKYTYYPESYTNQKTKMKIGCSIHGIFEQNSNNHKNGQGCPKCGKINRIKLKTLAFEEFEFQSNKIHNNKYVYFKESYINISTKTPIECPIHGIFLQRPSDHKSGIGCPICKSSKGELKINEHLKTIFHFKTQYKIEDCIHKKQLIFDFYIPELNTCIEFDGVQHFQFTPFFHKTEQDFKDQQLKDKIKTNYCLKNNIKLIKIPYTEFDNIETILSKELY